MKVIYIVGQNRSGTTLLSQLLGNHSEIFSAGELHHLCNFIKNKAKDECICGEKLENCEFWKRVIKVSQINPQLHDTRVKPYFKLQRILFGFFPIIIWLPKFLKKIFSLFYFEMVYFKKSDKINAHFELYKAISRASGKSIIVDNSKRVGLAYHLKKRFPDEVTLIFNYREGQSIIWSNYKRMKSFKRAFLSWKTHSMSIIMLKNLLYPNNIHNIYKDLCNNTELQMMRICKDIGIRFENSMLMINKQLHHDIGGSPSIRFSNQDKLEIKYIQDWENNLTKEEIESFNCKGRKIEHSFFQN